ncbi:MAG: toprim domain-containing protein, partial [Halieaceae bacterium]|nr:toprim domain-containing protein [Halieaceae bacterium]
LGTTPQRIVQLKLAGMLVENESGRQYDRFRERVVFPIRDARGRIIGFGGRVLGDDKPKYLNSPETPVFHKGRELYGLYQARQANRQLERVVIVEGYMDVIALAQHGISNATATLGTATGQAHLEKIYRLCPEVVFCFDGDSAGRQAARRALEAALPVMEDGRQARFLFLPEGEDPDTLVRARGAEHFHALLDAATPLEDFLFEALSENLDLTTLDGKARLSKLAAPMLGKLPAGVYRELMYKALADRTGMQVEALTRLVSPAPAEVAPASAGAPAPTPPQRPRQREPLARSQQGPAGLVQTAILLLLHQPAIAQSLRDTSGLDDLSGPDADLLRDLLALLKRRPESTTHMLLGHWYGTREGELLNRLASQERLIPAEGIESEFADTMAKLLKHPARRNFEKQVDNLRTRDYAEISEVEKLEILKALREKQHRDSEQGSR